MVPVRFVSEALGQDVDWNSEKQQVSIKTDTPSNNSIAPVSNVSVRDVDDQEMGVILRLASLNRLQNRM